MRKYFRMVSGKIRGDFLIMVVMRKNLLNFANGKIDL